MTGAPRTGRTGLLCGTDDPVAQLVVTLAPFRGSRQIVIEGPLDPGDGLDRILVTSQQRFVARAAALRQAARPVTLVVRRQGAEPTREWQDSLALLDRTLAACAELDVTLAALTDDAAAELTAALGRPVAAVAPPPHDSTGRAAATLDRVARLFTVAGAAGAPPRTLEADAVNWARLRARVSLGTDPSSDADHADLVAFFNSAGPAPPPLPGPPLVVFVVTNGVGLGHLTRLLAIAREMRRSGAARPVFWCYSRAAGLLESEGFPVLARQTATHLGCDREEWRRWECADLVRFAQANGVAAIVYDGSTVPAPARDAVKAPGMERCALIWIRRAMWRKGTDAGLLDAAQACDLVLVPGDLADAADTGTTVTHSPRHGGLAEIRHSDPVILTGRDEMLGRTAARRQLGLPRFGRLCLVSLGGDALTSHAPLATAIAQLEGHAGVGFVWAQSPLAARDPALARRVRTIDAYPLGPCLGAFDGIITAAGYNSFHEAMLLTAIPVLFAPSEHVRLDDQAARANHAAAQGWARVLPPDPGPGQTGAVLSFLDSLRRHPPVERPKHRHDGAAQLCAAIVAACAGRGPETVP